MMADKIRIAAIKRKVTITQLATEMRISQSNLSNKLKRDNFSEKELEEVAKVLNLEYQSGFVIPETGERI